MYTNAKPLTPLYSTVSVSGALLLQSVLIAVSLIPCFFHATLGVVFALFLFFVTGVHYLLWYRSANIFLNTSGETAEAQLEKSWDLFHELSNNATWIPFLGLFLFHEQFSSMLRALRGRYESTYWDAMLEKACKESVSGFVGTFILWLNNASASEEKKRIEVIVLLNNLLKYYEQRVDAHEKEDADYGRLMEKEDEAIASGNKKTVRDFYCVYTSKILSEHDILRRTKFLAQQKEITAILFKIKQMITAESSIDTCMQRFTNLSNRIFLRDHVFC